MFLIKEYKLRCSVFIVLSQALPILAVFVVIPMEYILIAQLVGISFVLSIVAL